MQRNVKKQIEHVDGTSVRQASTALLGISSKDRLSKYPNFVSPYNFSLYNQQNYLNGFFTQIALTQIKFPWAIPPITSNTGKMTVYVYISGVLQLPAVNIDVYLSLTSANLGGWISPTQLGTIVAAQINAVYAGSGTTCTLEGSPLAPHFAMSGNATYAYTIQSRPPLDEPNRTTIYDMMGWIHGVSETAQAVQIGGKSVNMLQTDFIDIVSNQLTYNQSVKDSDTGQYPRDIIARVYLVPTFPVPATQLELGTAPFTVFVDYNTPKQIKWASNIPIGALTFQVYDDQGYLLSTGDDAGDDFLPNWDMTLLATEV